MWIILMGRKSCFVGLRIALSISSIIHRSHGGAMPSHVEGGLNRTEAKGREADRIEVETSGERSPVD